MFIKILTPNHNGKIELTVRDLEALIEEAVEKAIREKCADCTKGWQNIPNITYLGNQPLNTKESVWDPYKITCTGKPGGADEMTVCLDSTLTTNSNNNNNNQVNGRATFINAINDMIGE